MTFVDTHCHLDDPKLRPDFESVVKEYKAQGVGIVINVGCDAATSAIVKEQAESVSAMYFTAGIHPMDVKDAKPDWADRITELATTEKCVAIGEIGLDYYWDKTFTEKQKEFFVAQLELAKTLKLPVNIHVRDAMGDAVELLTQNAGLLTYGGIMHCFSGSVEIMRRLIKSGLGVSFGGTLTFKNARSAPEVAKVAPAEFIYTETDSPYLSPEPLRGTVNSPKNIPIIAERLALLRGTTVEDVKATVYNNVKRLFPKIKE